MKRSRYQKIKAIHNQMIQDLRDARREEPKQEAIVSALALQVPLTNPKYSWSYDKTTPEFAVYNEAWKVLQGLRSTIACHPTEFRARHIAYCLLRGRTMDQIEGSHHKAGAPNPKALEKYRLEYEAYIAQADAEREVRLEALRVG